MNDHAAMVDNHSPKNKGGRPIKLGRFRIMILSGFLISAIVYITTAIFNEESLATSYHKSSGMDDSRPTILINDDTDKTQSSSNNNNSIRTESVSRVHHPNETTAATKNNTIPNQHHQQQQQHNDTRFNDDDETDKTRSSNNNSSILTESVNRVLPHETTAATNTTIPNHQQQQHNDTRFNDDVETDKIRSSNNNNSITESFNRRSIDELTTTTATTTTTTTADNHKNTTTTQQADEPNKNNNTTNEQPQERPTRRRIVAFERQEGVVIATKVHGPHQMNLLDQSLCLLHHAYNHRVLYDILVFTTVPLNETRLARTRQLVAPANLTVVVDNRGLQAEIAALSPRRRDAFLKRCKVTSPENLTWWDECPGRIAYNWQAEFRSWHIWRHSALADYRYMMWLDTDGFCTRPWEQDPIQTMIENDLVILFDNFPCGQVTGREVQERIFQAFNTTICSLRLNNQTGQLQAQLGDSCWTTNIPNIHGFMHITNLDFYRSDPVMTWAKTWIGDCFLCRKFDDQFAVTAPAAILAPNKSWDMRTNGIHLDIFHNYFMDGRTTEPAGGFTKYWRRKVQRTNFTAAPKGVCPITARG
jgi:hypothetical protein